MFEVEGRGSPVTILRGEAGEKEIRLAAAITARYSDARAESQVSVHWGSNHKALDKVMSVRPLEEGELAELRL